MKKKIILIIIAVVIIALIVMAIANGGKDKTEYVTAKVMRGEVVQTVDATGSVESAEAIELNFRTTGRIEAINISKGEQVKAGQVLARLEAGALSSRVRDGESALLEAKANLEQVMAGATAEDIRVSEVTVEQKKRSLETEKDDLKNLRSKSKTELKNLKDTAIITLNNELKVAESALETIDDTLNDKDAKDTLGVLDSGSVPRAEGSQDLAKSAVEDTNIYIGDIGLEPEDSEVIAGINVAQNALGKVGDCLSDVMSALEATIISNNLTEAELDALVADIDGEQTAISAAKTALQAAESNWTNKQVYYDEQIEKAQNDVKAAEDELELAEAQLEFKKAGPENYEINAYKAKVAKAEASLALAQANLGDAIIRAPVDGTVVEINYKKGEQTSLAGAVIEMIGRIELEIEVDISESDIAKVRVGQAVEVTLDSYGDDVIFNGSVTFIDPAETIIQDVVYYKTKVQFDGVKDDKQVKPGMTANTVIETDKKLDVLYVPIRAVKQRNGDRVVQVLIEEEIEEKQVDTGLRGDEFIEIMSGVEEGEEVITFIKNGE